jgi:MYND finger
MALSHLAHKPFRGSDPAGDKASLGNAITAMHVTFNIRRSLDQLRPSDCRQGRQVPRSALGTDACTFAAVHMDQLLCIGEQASALCRLALPVLQELHCCWHCGRLASKLPACKKCMFARFCSPECQAAAWPVHKSPCKNIHHQTWQGIMPAQASIMHVLRARTQNVWQNACRFMHS